MAGGVLGGESGAEKAGGEVDARLAELVIDAERALLSPAVRADRAALERLLHPRFVEIGQSGRLWSRAEMIDALVAEAAPSAEAATSVPVLTDINLTWVDGPRARGGAVLLTYQLRFSGRHSRRSSLWITDDVGRAPVVRLRFHQGTPLTAS